MSVVGAVTRGERFSLFSAVRRTTGLGSFRESAAFTAYIMGSHGVFLFLNTLSI